MSVSEAVVAAPVAAEKKTKKIAGPKKPAVKPTHPPTQQMVDAAIKALKEKSGSSLLAIKKYIAANYKVDIEKLNPFIKKYLKSSVVSGKFVQTKGQGATGSFKLSVSAKKSDEAPKLKKKKATVKKTGEKKATVKKTGEKKAAKSKIDKKPTAEKKKPTAAKKSTGEKKKSEQLKAKAAKKTGVVKAKPEVKPKAAAVKPKAASAKKPTTVALKKPKTPTKKTAAVATAKKSVKK